MKKETILDTLKNDFISILESKEYRSLSPETTQNPEDLTLIVLERNKGILTEEFFGAYTAEYVHDFLYDM